VDAAAVGLVVLAASRGPRTSFLGVLNGPGLLNAPVAALVRFTALALFLIPGAFLQAILAAPRSRLFGSPCSPWGDALGIITGVSIWRGSDGRPHYRKYSPCRLMCF